MHILIHLVIHLVRALFGGSSSPPPKRLEKKIIALQMRGKVITWDPRFGAGMIDAGKNVLVTLRRDAIMGPDKAAVVGQEVVFDCELEGAMRYAFQAVLVPLPQATRLVGTVKLWDDERAEGFLQTRSGDSAAIALEDVEDGEPLGEGQLVSFELEEQGIEQGMERRAVRVQRVA